MKSATGECEMVSWKFQMSQLLGSRSLVMCTHFEAAEKGLIRANHWQEESADAKNTPADIEFELTLNEITGTSHIPDFQF